MLTQRLRPLAFFGLLALACGGAEPPPPSAPANSERSAYDQGRSDGRKVDAAEWQATVRAKDAEIERLQVRLNTEAEATSRESSALARCETALAEAQHRLEEQQALVDAQQRALNQQLSPPPRTNVAPGPVIEPASDDADNDESPQSCCKICHKGKACGNSCISRSYTCHKGPGCACDG